MTRFIFVLALAATLSVTSGLAALEGTVTGFYWSPLLLDMGLAIHTNHGAAFDWSPNVGLGVIETYEVDSSAQAKARFKRIGARLEALDREPTPAEVGELNRALRELTQALARDFEQQNKWPIIWGIGLRLGGYFTSADLKVSDDEKYPGAYGLALGLEGFWKRFALSADYIAPIRRGTIKTKDCVTKNGARWPTCTLDEKDVTTRGNGVQASLIWEFGGGKRTGKTILHFGLRAYGGYITYPGHQSEAFGGLNALIRPIFP